jgi:hypothetical protein
MKLKTKNLMIFGIMSVIAITGCSNNNSIKDKSVDSRVKACSAGFTYETRSGLAASLDKAALSGQINSDVRDESKALIFSETPTKDHIRVYEDYIRCLESNWNFPIRKCER